MLYGIQESKSIYYVVEVYLTRWKCDDVRVRSYTAIRNTLAFVHACLFYQCIYGFVLKTKSLCSKDFYPEQTFFWSTYIFQYAMADGIRELLKKTRAGIEKIKFKGKTGNSSDDFQLSLFPD